MPTGRVKTVIDYSYTRFRVTRAAEDISALGFQV